MYRPSARAEVIATLIAAGGRVESSSGLASGALVDRIAETVNVDRPARNAAALLFEMETDREIIRNTKGRRTFCISLATETVPAKRVNDAVGLLLGSGTGDREVLDLLRAVGLCPEFATAAFAAAVVDVELDTDVVALRQEVARLRSTAAELEAGKAELERRAADLAEILARIRDEAVRALD